jgi:hypothetical protein
MRRSITRRTVARTGHAWGSPERPWPTISPRTAFFCSVKMRATNVEDNRLVGEAVSGSMGNVPFQSLTSARVNGCGLRPKSMNSPGRSRKKKASHIKSAAASEAGVALARAMEQAWWRAWSGIGSTRAGAESMFRKRLRICAKRGWRVVVPSKWQGSWWLAIVCADATWERASATMSAQTNLWEAESRPVRTLIAKICNQ